VLNAPLLHPACSLRLVGGLPLFVYFIPLEVVPAIASNRFWQFGYLLVPFVLTRLAVGGEAVFAGYVLVKLSLTFALWANFPHDL
jgi:hypothetical protein